MTWKNLNTEVFDAVWNQLRLPLRLASVSARNAIDSVQEDLPELTSLVALVQDSPEAVRLLLDLMFKLAAAALVAQGRVVLAKIVLYVGNRFIDSYLDVLWDKLFETGYVTVQRGSVVAAVQPSTDYDYDLQALKVLLCPDVATCESATCRCK